MITGLDHVQLAAPPGSEGALRAFYGGVLGLREIPKPSALADRGGCWFEAGPAAQLHLGAEPGFRPARKAHPALRVTGIRAYARRLAGHGVRVTWDDRLPDHDRFYAYDPVGNRLEFLERRGGG
ncbi:glyoxalase [Streptomyces albofaciens JCM 4342]|uniref:VOC family protein n=1 Tax=Streptomyces albofaciens TaxID=66866 RepID=UPI0012383FAC|nr:VOC family protein [Streptomyces albofaciens]KAA6221410.1 glyoxalase [Streptomyces albofaciens JCM 4342]